MTAESRQQKEPATKGPRHVLTRHRRATLLEQLRATRSQSRTDGILELPGETQGHQPAQDVLAAPEVHERRSVSLLRRGRAVLLPAIADRPLVMKRFPNGVAAQPFYQHRAPDVPPGVRVGDGNG